MVGSRRDKGILAAAAPPEGVVGPLASGAAARLDGLYRDHARELARYIAARFGAGPPEPEEVAQAAFAKLAASNDVGDLSNPRSYLYTIACNIVIDHYRRSGHRDAVHRDIAARADSETLSEFSPERVLLGKEQLALFKKALETMPKMRRRIFLLVRSEGHSATEVARRLGMTEGAVRRHVSRALQDCALEFEKAERQL